MKSPYLETFYGSFCGSEEVFPRRPSWAAGLAPSRAAFSCVLSGSCRPTVDVCGVTKLFVLKMFFC